MTNIARRDHPDSLPSRSLLPVEPRHSVEEDALVVRRTVLKVAKRKYFIAAVFLIVVVPAAIATFLTTPLYRSKALVQVNPDPVQVLPYRDVAETPIGAANFDNYMGTQEQLLGAAGLRVRVANRLKSDFKDDPASLEVPKLGDRFQVKRIEKSQLFELSYQAPDADSAAKIVNLFAEEYVRQHFEMKQAMRAKAEKDLKEELDGLEKRLRLSETELMNYAQANNIMSLEQGQVDPLQLRLSSINQQLAEAESAVAIARSSLDTVQTATVADFPQRYVSPQIEQLETTLLQKEQDLATLRTKFGENWPAVTEKRTEVALARDQLAREKVAILARNREQARLDLAGAEARRRMVLQSLTDQKALINQFHDASIRYSILKREADTNRNLYEGILERLRQTGIMAGFQYGNIQVVEPGRPNRIVDSPKVGWILGIASMLGLALGICLVVLQDTWRNSISTVEEAEQLAPLPMLGSVPLIRGSQPPALLAAVAGTRGSQAGGLLTGRSTNVSEQVPEVPFEVTESVRAICASILLSRSDERPRVIVVTSATPAEGKTTLVSHLGRAFAEVGSRTLLVEADLRKPDLSRCFSIGNEDGLSLYLAGHVSPFPKIHQTDVPNLFVAAGGPVPPNPAALLHSDRLATFLKAAAADYQVVILDVPPVLSMADARILGTKADGVVLVVRAGQTAKKLVRRAWAVLETSGVNVLGMVLNGWEPDRTERSHYRYYQSAPERNAKSA